MFLLAGSAQAVRKNQQAKQHPSGRRLVAAAPDQPDQQAQSIDQRANAYGQGQPGMLKIRHQRQVKQLGDHQHDDGNFHRRLDILFGIKARCQHLDGHQSEQPGAVAHQRAGSLLHVFGGESAVVIKRRDQWLRKRQQRHRRWHGQQHDDAQAPVEHG